MSANTINRPMPLEIINKILAALTIISQIFIAAGFLYFVLSYKNKEKPVAKFFGQNGIFFAFIVALSATIASLFYSEIAGFEPCKLCWFQRIFMYPQVIMLGMALLKKDYKIADYGLVLAAMGGFFSFYHGYIYYGGSSILPCSASGLAVSCAARYVFEFGFVTIPLMSLTTFVLVFSFLWLNRFYHQKT